MIHIKGKLKRNNILVNRGQTEAEYATREELNSQIENVNEYIQEVDDNLADNYVSKKKFYEDKDEIDRKIAQLNDKLNDNRIDATGFKFQGSTFTDFPSEKFVFYEYMRDFSYMFYDCRNLKSVNLESGDVRGVILPDKTTSMFEGCESLTNVSSNLYVDDNANSMFKNCRNLEYFDTLGTHLDNTEYMFYDCKNLKRVNAFWGGGGNTTLTLSNTCAYMFYGCESLTSIEVKFEQDINSLDTTGMFYHCYNLTNFAGFKNLKSNLDITDCKKLTLESCINLLNDLYDFNANNITPKKNEGNLSVSTEFQNIARDYLSIATNKGWKIS